MNYVEEFELNVDKFALNIDQDKRSTDCEMISFVGAGGKTTTMFQTAQQLADLGCKVLVTTTTMIFVPEPEQYDHLIVLEDGADHARAGLRMGTIVEKAMTDKSQKKQGSITVMGHHITEEGKLCGVDGPLLNVFRNKGTFEFILVEADGSKRKPIKAPAEHEPVIPSLCCKVVGVIGMDALGTCICEEHVHRVQQFCIVTGGKPGDVIAFSHVEQLVSDPQGLFKGAGRGVYKYVLLNKVDPKLSQQQLDQMKHQISCLDSRIRNVLTVYRKSELENS